MTYVPDNDNVSRFYKSINKSMKSENESGRTIFIGKVVEIFAYGGDFVVQGRMSPPGTIKAFIPNLDATKNIEELSFYEPFQPIHSLALPEIGEEVIIQFDSSDLKKGYWVSRNDSNKPNKTLSLDVIKDLDMTSRIGDLDKDNEQYDFKEKDESPDANAKIPAFRKKPGDVFQQGRSNTLVHHTFSKDTKEGIIDIQAGRTGSVDSDSQNFTEIKNREFNDAKSRIMVISNFNADKNNDWDLTSKPGFAGSASHSRGSYLLLNTGEFRFVSNKSSNQLNNAVLGNLQEKWLNKFINILSDLISILSQEQLVQCGPQGAPNIKNIVAPQIKPISSRLKALAGEISNHHSKVNFLN